MDLALSIQLAAMSRNGGGHVAPLSPPQTSGYSDAAVAMLLSRRQHVMESLTSSARGIQYATTAMANNPQLLPPGPIAAVPSVPVVPVMNQGWFTVPTPILELELLLQKQQLQQALQSKNTAAAFAAAQPLLTVPLTDITHKLFSPATAVSSSNETVSANTKYPTTNAARLISENESSSKSMARILRCATMNQDHVTEYAGIREGVDPLSLAKLSFPEKIHFMLESVASSNEDNVVSYVDNGTAFMIHKPRVFETEIMPLYFSSTRLSSLQRQLNIYGFERVDKGPWRGAYQHVHFVRGKTHLLRKIKRCVANSNGKKEKA